LGAKAEEPRRAAKVNLPNLITALRIILTPLFVILVINAKWHKALIVFAIAAASDGLDGFLARALRQKTELGTYLDPIADKLLLSSAYISLAVLKVLPSWLTVIVISRDVIIVLGIIILHLLQCPIRVRPLAVSKVTTFFQIVTLLAVLVVAAMPQAEFARYLRMLSIATAALTIASGLAYMYVGVVALTAREEGGA
jgi:cardiolipin synthase